MSERRKGGLGRGLGALIPSSASLTDGEATPAEAAAKSDLTEQIDETQRAGTSDTVDTVAAKQLSAPEEPATEPAQKKPVSRETRSRTPRSRPGRPVDFFFQPGRTEDEATDEQDEISTSGINLDRLRVSMDRPTTRKKRATAAADSDADQGQTTAAGRAEVGSEDVKSSPSSASDAPRPADVATDGLLQVPGARFAEIPTNSIRPNSKQPRSNFDEEEMDELVHSVKEIGVLQPIVVRPDTSGVAEYELVMGERRWRATQKAGLTSIPAIIRDTSDDDLLRDALLENLHRSQLNPLEEAAAYQQLLTEFGCSQEELSRRIGRSRPQISNTIRLMKLPPIVQLKVAAGTITAGHARALLGLDDPSKIVEMSQKIVNEGLSVRTTEELVSQQDGLRQKGAEKKKAAETPRHERLDYLATTLADRLDTNVKITLGARKGKVQIDFASVEDLNRIMDLLAKE